MLNYLSFVKVIRWRKWDYLQNCWLEELLGYQKDDICKHLTWALVSHRLDEIEELEIDIDDQERYLQNAAKLTSLHKVWTHVGRDHDCVKMFDCAEVMVKAIQQHHGPYQLKECHLIPNLLEYVEMFLEYYKEEHKSDHRRTWRVVSLLPPPKQYLTLPRLDGSIVSFNLPLDPYVATIEGLTSLSIDSEVINDENFLVWAAYEAEHCYHRSGGQQFTPLVPLESFEITFNCRESGSTPKLKILQDGLLGFSRTLKSLKVTYNPSSSEMVDYILTFNFPRPLHKLKELTLWNSNIDRPSWEQAPTIEDLSIRFDFPPSIFYTPILNEPQGDQDTGTTPLLSESIGTTIINAIANTVAAKQQSQRQLPEFWFHCPKLTSLALQGEVINFLDPSYLHHLPNLKYLDLWNPSHPRHVTDRRVKSCEALGVLKVAHPTRWTWNWSFPMLRVLRLKGDLLALNFSSAILRSCPTIKYMNLTHNNHGGHDRFPLRVKGIFDATLDKSNNQMAPFTHSNLNSLKFDNDWDIEVDELAYMLQVLTGLMEIGITSSHSCKRFGARELIEITKTHPSLINVITSFEITAESLLALGLSGLDDRYNYQKALESVFLARYDDDIEIPKTRSRIVYTFKCGEIPSPWVLPL
ncbi:hypothetical protein BGW42_004662 [Actinomortierella wolfii]|nr:hypothetical protein BGW42_004662 [Actinomortierella wolfii]